MDSNRSEILAQLASGQITADQAAEQLRGAAAGAAADAAADAAPNPPETPGPAAAPAPEATAAARNRWLRVRVSDMASGRQRVSVNLPLSWLAIGLRIGARFSPEVAELDPDDILAAIQAGNVGQVVDVEDLDDGQRVQVFIE